MESNVELHLKRNKEAHDSWMAYTLTFDHERSIGLTYDESQAFERYDEAKALVAQGWDMNKFIEEWF
jgi:hypothetical protein